MNLEKMVCTDFQTFSGRSEDRTTQTEGNMVTEEELQSGNGSINGSINGSNVPSLTVTVY